MLRSCWGVLIKWMAVFASFILIFPLTGPQPLRRCRPWALCGWAIGTLKCMILPSLSSLLPSSLELSSSMHDWEDHVYYSRLILPTVLSLVLGGLITFDIERRYRLAVMSNGCAAKYHDDGYSQQPQPSLPAIGAADDDDGSDWRTLSSEQLSQWPRRQLQQLAVTTRACSGNAKTSVIVQSLLALQRRESKASRDV